MKTVTFRYTHTANVTGTSPGHYYESDQRYASGTYVPIAEVERLRRALEDIEDLSNPATWGQLPFNAKVRLSECSKLARKALEVK
jgi:hypothetical protein